MKEVNLLIIGVGLHAQRVYVPYLLGSKMNGVKVNLCVGVDLRSQKEKIDRYLTEKHLSLEMLYIDEFNYEKGLPEEIEHELDLLVLSHNIDGVLITTEPLVHKVYAMWAIKKGLHILMDKPITTRKNVITNLNEAEGIYDDYYQLLNSYKDLQSRKQTIFTINVQRRYEIGHQKVIQLVKEVSNRFAAPVTSIQAMHADGVWIFPNEVVDQVYHPYSSGYGKNSHSGYHIFDIVWQYFLAGKVENKFPDSAEVVSSHILPSGLLKQFPQEDYLKYFGTRYSEAQKRSDKELFDLYSGYGEIDAFSLLRLLKEGDNICNISINLLHNSFSRRSWLNPSNDLYKGNGRVKHQSYTIQQGPFQCVQVHNYQSNDKQDQSNIEDYKLGGNNHFDIYVFRNAAMFGKKQKPLTVYNLKNLDIEDEFDDTKLFHEKTKEAVVTEFIDFIIGKNTDVSKLKSNITSHEVPVKIMSAIYKSHVLQRGDGSSFVKFKL